MGVGTRGRVVTLLFWRTRVSAAVRVALLLAVAPDPALAFDIEPDSVGNRLYVLLWHGNLSASLDSVGVVVTMPSFTSATTPLHVPTTVPAASGRLAGFSFDVLPVATGLSGDAVVTVTGTVAGTPVLATFNVPLVTVVDAPAIVIVDSLLDNQIEAPDFDGDGVADSVELHYGSNPADPNSLPGMSNLVPALSPAAIAMLALLLAAVALTARMGLRRLR